MNENILVLDKRLAKKTVVKSKILSILDVLTLFPLFISLFTGNGYGYFLAMTVLANIWKIIIITAHIRRINNDDFFVVKSVIIGEEILEGEDTESYYKYFKYNCASGSVRQPVSKSIFNSYKNGDCFYLLFFKDNKKKQRPAKYIFACDMYGLDSEMKVGYADCSHWSYTETVQLKEKKGKPVIPFTERMQSVTEEEKEKIMEVGKKVSLLGKGMLVSGIVLFVLLVAVIASYNTTVLAFMLIAGAVFFGCLYKIIAVTNNAPEYDGVIYYGLKLELKKKNAELQKREKEEQTAKLQDEPQYFERDFPKEQPLKKKSGVLMKMRKIPAVLIGLFFLAMVISCICDGVDSENIGVFLSFITITLISVLMVITKIRLLSLMYIAGFFFCIAAEAFFVEKSVATGIVLTIFGLIPALPVLLINLRKENI